MSKAFITGISGQDAAYLSKFLLERGYEVIGGERQNASRNLWRLKALGVDKKIKMIPFELLDENNINKGNLLCIFYLIQNWCGREDLNLQGVSSTTTSTLRVYQFRHDRSIFNYNQFFC